MSGHSRVGEGCAGAGGKKVAFFRAKAETFDPRDEFCCKNDHSGGEVFQSDLVQVEKGKLPSVFNFLSLFYLLIN